jgi:hypothetical protein
VAVVHCLKVFHGPAPAFLSLLNGCWTIETPSQHHFRIHVGCKGQYTDLGVIRRKGCAKTPTLSKGKAPATSPEPAVGNRKPTLGIDTRSKSRQSYGTITDQLTNGGPSHPLAHSPETYRSSHLLFDVPEEVDDDDMEALLEEEGFYLGSCSL